MILLNKDFLTCLSLFRAVFLGHPPYAPNVCTSSILHQPPSCWRHETQVPSLMPLLLLFFASRQSILNAFSLPLSLPWSQSPWSLAHVTATSSWSPTSTLAPSNPFYTRQQKRNSYRINEIMALSCPDLRRTSHFSEIRIQTPHLTTKPCKIGLSPSPQPHLIVPDFCVCLCFLPKRM